VTLVLDVSSKSSANVAEVLWSCYWASALIAIGMMVDSELLVSAGFIFQVGVGGPAWTLGLIYGQDVQLPSVLLHVIPPLAGLLYVSGMPEIPKAATAIAWLVHPSGLGGLPPQRTLPNHRPVSLVGSLLWRNDELNVTRATARFPQATARYRERAERDREAGPAPLSLKMSS
jgi:hypothetical protein